MAVPNATEQSGWIRSLARYVLPHRGNLALALLAALIASACLTIVPLVARHIIDHVIGTRSAALWPWLVLLIGVAVLAFWMSYLRRYRGGMVALQVQYDLRNAMHDHLQAMDLGSLSRMSTGQLVSRANSDSTLVQALLNFLPIMSGNVLLLLLSLAVMVYLSPLLALVSIVVLPALIVVSYRLRRRVFPATWDGQQREGEVAQIVDEDVNGVRVVKAFGQEHRELVRILQAARMLYGARMRGVRLQARYQPMLEAIPSLAQVAILALGGWMTMRGDISLGTFLAFSTYIAQFVAPARQLAGMLNLAQQARAGVERIVQLLQLSPAVVDSVGALDIGAIRGEITFENVHFGYTDTRPVLTGIDLRIAPGERVAVIGASGSGKSSIADLISRFYDPDQGAVFIDGRDLRTVTKKSIRSQIGVAFEDSFLFSDSVRANIAYGRPDAPMAAIEAAARAAAADGFISELPRAYDTTVGERGLSLSGGQRQRIALARAILTNPRILILDDATSAVDAVTEEAIYDALGEVLADRTTMLIAHRLSTVRLADRVVILAGGRVVDQGSHQELAERSATYRALLSGLDSDRAATIGDRIEALAPIATAGITSSAWQPTIRGPQAASSMTSPIGAPTLGPGLGGGGGGAWRLGLAATPELLAKVAELPPIRDFTDVDLEHESPPQHRFTLRSLLSEFRRPLLVGLTLVILDALADLAGPVLVKIGIDRGVAHTSQTALFAVSGLFLLMSLADLIDQIGETFVTGRAAERIMLSLRVRVWAQLQRLSLDYYESEMAGRIMTRMTTDVDQFESLIENGLLSALVSLVTFVGVGVALVVINLELGLWTLTVAIPLAVATVFFRRRAALLYDEARERIAIVNADFQESLSGVRESQAFVHEDATVIHFRSLGQRYLQSRISAQRLVASYFPFVQFLAAVADAIVLGVGARLIATGHLSTGALIAFLLYIDMFFSPIQQLSQVFDSWQQTRVSVRRIADLMAMTTLTPSPSQPVNPGRLRGDVRLQDVRFSYPLPAARQPDHHHGPEDARLPGVPTHRPSEALRGIDLHIRAGETVALVGETGAGKSTVMKLLARFYDPDEGSVQVDGHDLRQLDLAGFRSQLGYVPQEAFLFSATIRDNIAYGRPEASDAQVEAAARAVGAHELIAELPGGYLHELSERGRSLSSGQQQLIALARAELVDPAILLLDEATSNLDLASEAKVAAAMRQVSRERTTIVIAHRLQTARAADRIVVLRDGSVAEAGTHEELLSADGPYAAMWRAFELVNSAR